MYGPTENCVDSTYFDITAGFDAGETSIPIGIPIPGTEVLVLDENMQRTPDGELGEICVAGLGLARGYLNDPALTAERFVAHPFESGQRIYRTSDWGRWRCDGNLEFHGRFDNQVKIRGYRVELDEIGTQMEHLDGIRRAVAVARGKSGPNVTLVAFYESQTPLDSKALRKALACSLPPWMLPSEFVWSASLPSTSNGKIDRRKLQEMLPSAQRRNEPASVPATDLERKLTQAFCSVLGQDDVRVTDDFFELGGDSLKSAQLLGRIRTDFGVRLAFADFMEHRTVRRVAGRLKHASQDNSTIAKAAEHASYELSHAQKRIWLLHQMPGGNSAYNIPMVFGEDGTLDLKRLEHAFRRLIGRHESLRTSFRVVGHEPRQFIELSAEFMVSEADFRGCVNAESLARSLAEEEAAMSFSLDKAPLMRARLVRVTEERTLLLLTVHHIITDGWSLTILFRELSALYSGAVESELPATRIRYRDYSEWHNARRFDREREYWTKQLEGVPSHLRLPYDFADQSGAFQGASEEAIVPHAIARALRRVAERRQTTMSLVVLAIFQMFLYRLTKQPDFCVGLGVANRSHSDLEHVVGFFVNVVPIRALFSEDQSVEATIDQLISRSYEAFDHQDYPIDLMVRDLAIERIGSSQPLFNVMFAFQNFSELTLPGDCDPGSQAIVHASRLERHAFETSKFNLTLFVWDHGTELRWMLEYDTRRFRPTTARRYLSFLTSIAKAVGDNIS
jgi:acyl carrier protein